MQQWDCVRALIGQESCQLSLPDVGVLEAVLPYKVTARLDAHRRVLNQLQNAEKNAMANISSQCIADARARQRAITDRNALNGEHWPRDVEVSR